MARSIIAAAWWGVFFLAGNAAKKEGRNSALCFIFSLSSNPLIGFIVVALSKQGRLAVCEMLAAAFASCMSTMVALEMAKLGIRPVTVNTHTVLTLDNPGDRWQITGVI